jgi:hypothetical protein
MLTPLDWCTSVALCLDPQPIASKADPIRHMLVRRVPLAESKQKPQILRPRTTERWRNCRKIPIALIMRLPHGEYDFGHVEG